MQYKYSALKMTLTALIQGIFSLAYSKCLCTSLYCFIFFNSEIQFHSTDSNIIQSLLGMNVIKNINQHLAVESLAVSSYNMAIQMIQICLCDYFLDYRKNVKGLLEILVCVTCFQPCNSTLQTSVEIDMKEYLYTI